MANIKLDNEDIIDLLEDFNDFISIEKTDRLLKRQIYVILAKSYKVSEKTIRRIIADKHYRK